MGSELIILLCAAWIAINALLGLWVFAATRKRAPRDGEGSAYVAEWLPSADQGSVEAARPGATPPPGRAASPLG